MLIFILCMQMACLQSEMDTGECQPFKKPNQQIHFCGMPALLVSIPGHCKIFGASMSEPHTSLTALCTHVCMLVWTDYLP